MIDNIIRQILREELVPLQERLAAIEEQLDTRKKMLTIKEVSQEYGYGRRYLMQQVEQGALTPHGNGKYLFNRKEIEKL